VCPGPAQVPESLACSLLARAEDPQPESDSLVSEEEEEDREEEELELELLPLRRVGSVRASAALGFSTGGRTTTERK